LRTAFAAEGPVYRDIGVEPNVEKIPPVFNWLRRTGVDPWNVGDEVLV